MDCLEIAGAIEDTIAVLQWCLTAEVPNGMDVVLRERIAGLERAAVALEKIEILENSEKE